MEPGTPGFWVVTSECAVSRLLLACWPWTRRSLTESFSSSLTH
jgi:hypothetical protein